MTAEELALVVPTAPGQIAGVVEGDPEIARLGDLYALAGEVEAARVRLREALEEQVKDRPESPELSVAEARSAVGLDTRLADALIAGSAEGSEPEIRVTEAGVSLRDVEEMPPELEKEADGLLEVLRRAGVEPPTTEATPAARLLLKRGEVVRIDAGLFAASEAVETILEEVKSACREDGEISLAGFRDRMGTSRKYAQAWLEYADEAGVTRRVGDARVLTRRYR
jgi:selenocysteine-specific elongation factor